jgi:hypothetical protein
MSRVLGADEMTVKGADLCMSDASKQQAPRCLSSANLRSLRTLQVYRRRCLPCPCHKSPAPRDKVICVVLSAFFITDDWFCTASLRYYTNSKASFLIDLTLTRLARLKPSGHIAAKHVVRVVIL